MKGMENRRLSQTHIPDLIHTLSILSEVSYRLIRLIDIKSSRPEDLLVLYTADRILHYIINSSAIRLHDNSIYVGLFVMYHEHVRLQLTRHLADGSIVFRLFSYNKTWTLDNDHACVCVL